MHLSSSILFRNTLNINLFKKYLGGDSVQFTLYPENPSKYEILHLQNWLDPDLRNLGFDKNVCYKARSKNLFSRLFTPIWLKLLMENLSLTPPSPLPICLNMLELDILGARGGLLSGLSPSLPPGKVVASVFGGKAGKFETPPPLNKFLYTLCRK